MQQVDFIFQMQLAKTFCKLDLKISFIIKKNILFNI